ncbi:hypothetical protein [Nonomuraea africana]|uniref:hypothetical protein n=1 Tax=Nonomuraea africana TaxID=46171 RepID=UPI0033E62E95
MTRKASMLALLVTALVAVGATVLVTQSQSSTRQAKVAAKGAQVMPFDLDRTTHQFTKNTTGGVQTVTADDPADATQIRLIREHLTEESAKFGRGDFGDPATIHGGQMPGLAELSKGYKNITLAYAETPDGARLTYTTGDKALVTALHAWFDAQVSDHGKHATH